MMRVIHPNERSVFTCHPTSTSDDVLEAATQVLRNNDFVGTERAVVSVTRRAAIAAICDVTQARTTNVCFSANLRRLTGARFDTVLNATV
jgi:hypothetical protein